LLLEKERYMTEVLKDKMRAALVGVHVGDSYGAPWEIWRADAIEKDQQTRPNNHMFDYPNTRPDDNPIDIFPAGRPTDDSDQTADLCHSLIACNDLNIDHLRESLRHSVVDGKSRLWDGKASGGGSYAKVALSLDPEERLPTTLYNIGTNGSLMRCAPMALHLLHTFLNVQVNQKQINACRKLVDDMSSVTHSHTHAKQACWIYTLILSSLLIGNDVQASLITAESIDPKIAKYPMTVRIASQLHDPSFIPYDPGNGKESTKAEFSLYVALYALMNTNSFEAGIEMAVRVGGDTDTYAAIAGGLLGAHYGYAAIPENWRTTILGHDQMITYADALYEMRTDT
jgi:ADP-ribosylglycohydrolase